MNWEEHVKTSAEVLIYWKKFDLRKIVPTTKILVKKMTWFKKGKFHKLSFSGCSWIFNFFPKNYFQFPTNIFLKSQWIMTYLAWGRQGLFQTFYKVVLHKRHCCWPTTYFLPFLSLLMNIVSWKFEATQTWGRRNMLRLLKTASGS